MASLKRRELLAKPGEYRDATRWGEGTGVIVASWRGPLSAMSRPMLLIKRPARGALVREAPEPLAKPALTLTLTTRTRDE